MNKKVKILYYLNLTKTNARLTPLDNICTDTEGLLISYVDSIRAMGSGFKDKSQVIRYLANFLVLQKKVNKWHT